MLVALIVPNIFKVLGFFRLNHHYRLLCCPLYANHMKVFQISSQHTTLQASSLQHILPGTHYLLHRQIWQFATRLCYGYNLLLLTLY